MSFVQETAETACFVTGNCIEEARFLLLQTARRTDAIGLEAIIETDPKSTLCAKLLKGLLAHKKKGRWLNTQENTYVLLAVNAYFQAFEKNVPNFESNIWFGNTHCLSQDFKERSVDTHSITIPTSYLIDTNENNSLILQKQGNDGRMYYRIGLTYAPRSTVIEAYSSGFTITRQYVSMDKKDDVIYDENEKIYKVKAGARVKIQLSMTNQIRRFHVALVDYLPAAFEPLNPSLKGTGNVTLPFTPENKNYCWWNSPWYEHQNYRDERVEAFSSYLRAGVHEYSYVARCTQIGEFIVPPAKAEEMYNPEIFGRSNSTRVEVLAEE